MVVLLAWFTCYLKLPYTTNYNYWKLLVPVIPCIRNVQHSRIDMRVTKCARLHVQSPRCTFQEKGESGLL